MSIPSIEPGDRFRSYAMVFDELPIVAFVMELDGNISFLSRAWTDFSGFDVAATLAAGAQSFIVEEDRERARFVWEAAIAAGVPYSDEFRMQLRDGSVRWVVSQATPLADSATGWVTGWFGTIADIDHRKSIEVALHDSEAMARAVASAIPGVTWAASPDGELTFVGDAWVEVHGSPLNGALGDAWLAAVHPDDLARVGRVWSHALATGEPYKIEFRLRVADGSYRWFLVRAACVRNDAGAIVRWVGVNLDIDDKVAGEAERKRIEDGLRLLSRTGAAVVNSLDFNRTLENIAGAFIEGFAAYCIIDIIDPTDRWLRIVSHRDANRLPILHELSRPAGQHPIARAIDFGESSRSQVDATWVDSVNADAGRRTAVRALAVRSVIVVPIVTPDGLTAGALTCALDDGDVRDAYDAKDQQFVEEVGRRAGSAIANARLYERERRIAIELQSASLPEHLPDIPGVTLDAEYRPGSDEATIGGDWYDAFALEDGRVAITVGDVLGHGLHAAVTMTKLRQAMQSAAMVDADPLVMLAVADRTIRLADSDGYATALAAIYDPRDRTVTFASAGHPGPLLHAPGQDVETFECPGLMIGLRSDAERETATIAIPASATLVFYTDGLVESTRDIFDGQSRLRAALGDPAFLTAQHPARTLVGAVLGAGVAGDDIAVLVAHFR